MVAAICPMFRMDVASLPSRVSLVPCMIMVRSGCVMLFSLICSRSWLVVCIFVVVLIVCSFSFSCRVLTIECWLESPINRVCVLLIGFWCVVVFFAVSSSFFDNSAFSSRVRSRVVSNCSWIWFCSSISSFKCVLAVLAAILCSFFRL